MAVGLYIICARGLSSVCVWDKIQGSYSIVAALSKKERKKKKRKNRQPAPPRVPVRRSALAEIAR